MIEIVGQLPTSKQGYRYILVKTLKTSCYRPQTDGLVECFNQTLKQMLQRVLKDEGKNLDRFATICLVCLQRSTTSINWLQPLRTNLWSRCTRTLGHFKEACTKDTTEGDDIATYVDRVYERLELAKDIVQENLEKAQRKQKEWYDQTPCKLDLKEGS